MHKVLCCKVLERIYPCAMGSAGTALASHFQPSRPWVPSQNGRFDESPQRQSEIAGFPVKSHSFPLTSTSEIGPSTRNGPSTFTVIFTDGALFNTSSDIKLPLFFLNGKTPSDKASIANAHQKNSAAGNGVFSSYGDVVFLLGFSQKTRRRRGVFVVSSW
jgi:hypothetical protein